MKPLTAEERETLKERYPTDELVQRLLASSFQADALLGRSLWEFGAELRTEVERYLGQKPLLPGGAG